MGAFDLDALIKAYAQDGQEIGGDLIYWYDEDHKQKVKKLLELDTRYFYYIEILCEVNPFDESRYGPDTELRIVNVDHFAIKKSAKDKADYYRDLVYSKIDFVYTHKNMIDLDYEVYDEDGGFGDGFLETAELHNWEFEW